MGYDVLIVGAGVTGCAIAHALSRYKLSVLVVDAAADVAMGASRANSAIVHAGYDCVPGTAMARVNVRGNAMFDELCKQLHVPLKRIGSLVLAFDQEDQKAIERLYDYGIQNGVPGVELLSAAKTQAMQPGLSEQVTGSLYAPTGAITCPYELTQALCENAMANGVTFKMDSRVTAVCTQPDGVTVTLNGEETVCARFIVNAAGLYADEISKMAGGETFTIHARKGEYILLDRAASGFVGRVLFQAPTAMGKGVLVAPTVDGNAYMGPTAVEQTSKEDTAVSAEGLEELKRVAVKSMPKLPVNRAITMFAGLRAVVNEKHDFILGISASNPCLIQAAGICSPGLSSAPAIAEEIVSALQKAGLELRDDPDYQPERPHDKRFRDMNEQERAAAIASDPAYGRIICRCETVPEAEIVRAIHAMPGTATVDGVKRRTRAGMGRCQGGFCMPRVMELIEREAGIPMEKITKSGGGSYLIAEPSREGGAR